MNEGSNVNKWLVGAVVVLLIIIGAQNMKSFGGSNPKLNSASALDANDVSSELDAMDTNDKLSNSGSVTNSQTNTNSLGTVVSDKTTLYLPLFVENSVENIGTLVGCGSRLVFVPYEVPHTVASLSATYKTLFSLPASVSFGEYAYTNEIANQTKDRTINTSSGSMNFSALKFSKATIQNGVASIYLTGDVISNECADPRLAAQIEYAAKHFPNVRSVETFVNDKPFNWKAWLSSGKDPI